jgi:hypothetical protein
MRTFDVSRWHSACTGKYVIGTGDGPFIVCPVHFLVAHVGDIGVRISPASSYNLDPEAQIVIAQPSDGVPGGRELAKTGNVGMFTK